MVQNTIRNAQRVGLVKVPKGHAQARWVVILLACWWSVACAATPRQLTLPAISISDPAFQSSLEAFSGAPIVGDNRVEILLNGEETFPAMLHAIRAAKSTVTFEAYIFRGVLPEPMGRAVGVAMVYGGGV